MNIVEAVLLGIVQGLTEWLPVSSSGHLALVEGRLGEVSVFFNIALHFGTTLILIIFFRKEILKVLKEFAGTFRETRKGTPFKKAWGMNGPRRMAWMIIIASIPTFLMGYIFNLYLVDRFYDRPELLGGAFLLTGGFLLLTIGTKGMKEARAGKARAGTRGMTPTTAVFVGASHGLALLPGVSRSGATISTAMVFDMDVVSAGRFSFILAIPAVMGAMVLHVIEAVGSALEVGWGPLIAGTITSMIVGYLSLFALFRILRRGVFHLFAPYCIALGLVVILIV